MLYPKLKIESAQPYLDYAVVIKEKGAGFVVATSFGYTDAEVALSCLIRPETGDRVLVCQDQTNQCFILSVLNRTDKKEQPINISFPTEVNIHMEKGGLSIRSEEDVSLAAQNRISMISQDLVIQAEDGQVCMKRFSFLGRVLNAHIEKIKMFGSIVDSIFKRFTQRVKSCLRYVEEHEEVQTGSTRYLVEETLTIRSKNSVHTAKAQMKVDAEQIHLG